MDKIFKIKICVFVTLKLGQYMYTGSGSSTTESDTLQFHGSPVAQNKKTAFCLISSRKEGGQVLLMVMTNGNFVILFGSTFWQLKPNKPVYAVVASATSLERGLFSGLESQPVATKLYTLHL